MTQAPLMRGIETLRDYIAGYLRVALPPVMEVARIVWNKDEFLFPDIQRFDMYDPTLNNIYPALGVFATNTRDFIRNDINDDGSQSYKATYAVRIVLQARTPLREDGSTWVTPEKESASRLLTDLTAVVQNVLLQTPSLGRPDLIELNEVSMTVDYLEPQMHGTQTKVWVAGSIISVDVRLEESTLAFPYGEVPSTGVIREIQKLIP